MQSTSQKLATDTPTGLPPSVESYALSPDVVTLSSKPNEAESFRALRTHIMARHVQDGRRALAVCAVAPETGCTFVAANLAVALSQIGLKTLLIDANMRQPGVDKLFRPSGPVVGLEQCLASKGADYAAFIQHDVLQDLSIMFAGGTPTNPQELLSSDRFEDLLSWSLRDYEMTVVDTPPASTCSDANRVSSVVGYSVVVARRDKTLYNDIRTLCDQLVSDRARVVGTVLTEF